MSRKILVAVDEHIMRLGLVALLKQNGHSRTAVEEAGTVEKAISLLESGQRYVTLLRMAKPDADRCLTCIRANDGAAILIDPESPINLQELLSMGVRGLLFSPIFPDPLAISIATVSAGDMYIGPLNNEKSVARTVLETTVAETDYDCGDRLTQREAEIVQRLLQGCTNKQIADSLFLSLSTVKSHLRRIMAKFEVRDRIGVISQITQRKPGPFAAASEPLSAPNL